MKLFLDTEFTGLHQNTDLISIGLISEDNRTFYAESTDFDSVNLEEWIKENVVENLRFNDENNLIKIDSTTKIWTDNYSIDLKQNIKKIAFELKLWLNQFESVEIWSDCLAYDWVLFCELFGGALDKNLPNNVYYIPFDICTLFKMKGIDPDISREGYAGMAYGEGADDEKDTKHNALWDAMVIKGCYERLVCDVK